MNAVYKIMFHIRSFIENNDVTHYVIRAFLVISSEVQLSDSEKYLCFMILEVTAFPDSLLRKPVN